MTTLKYFTVTNDDEDITVEISRHYGWSSKDGRDKPERVSVCLHDIEHDNVCREALEAIVNEMKKYDTNEKSNFSDEYEEEELQRLEKKLEQCQQTQETCCEVALAYQLSQIQKFLRDSGADIELVVHKDFIAINDENCKEYRGNVEQILRYIKASGELSKVADEMDRRN